MSRKRYQNFEKHDTVECTTSEYKFLRLGDKYKVQDTRYSSHGNLNIKIGSLYYWAGNFSKVSRDPIYNDIDPLPGNNDYIVYNGNLIILATNNIAEIREFLYVNNLDESSTVYMKIK